MSTPSSMILTGLGLLGVKAPGDSLTTDEETEYLSRLNMMLESWDNDGLTCYATQSDSKALTAGVSSYTIGTGGDINVAWPVKIESAYTVDGAGISRGIDIVGNDEWGDIVLKQLGNGYPSKLWYDNSYPLGDINLWMKPLGGLTLWIISYQRLQNFPLISTAVSLPPGYEGAIISNLAVDWLSPGLMEPSPSLVKSAQKGLALLKKNNVQIPKLSVPGDSALPQQSQFPMPPW